MPTFTICAYCEARLALADRARGTCPSCASVERRRVQRKILIVGLPRSGTTFVAKVLSRLLRVSHEQVNTHGTVSWMLVVDDPEAYSFGHQGERRSDYDFGLVVHLVREPIACISSLLTMHPEFFAAVDKHCGAVEHDTLAERCAGSWVAWNRLIEAQADVRVRVEDVSTGGLGKKVNSRKHDRLDWADFGRYRGDVFELAVRYGYQ